MSAKPHFRFKAHVWSCATRDGHFWRIGYGYTVREAWTDWEGAEYL